MIFASTDWMNEFCCKLKPSNFGCNWVKRWRRGKEKEDFSFKVVVCMGFHRLTVMIGHTWWNVVGRHSHSLSHIKTLRSSSVVTSFRHRHIRDILSLAVRNSASFHFLLSRPHICSNTVFVSLMLMYTLWLRAETMAALKPMTQTLSIWSE